MCATVSEAYTVRLIAKVSHEKLIRRLSDLFFHLSHVFGFLNLPGNSILSDSIERNDAQF